MDFFNVGFVLCALNFKFGTELNFALRLIGTGFMLGGLREMALYYGEDRLGRHRGGVIAVGLLSAAGLAEALCARFGITGGGTGNILSTAAGLLCGGAVLASQRLLLNSLIADTSLINDLSLMKRLSKTWNWYAIFAGVSLIAEAVGRFAVTDSVPHLASGVAQVFSRVLMYIYVIAVGVAFNRCRTDFNRTHPA